MSTQPSQLPIKRQLTLVDKSLPVTQARLKKFYEMQEHYLEEKRKFEALEAAFKKEEQALALQTIAGAPIRTGHFKPRFKLVKVRHPRYKEALINAKGEHYQQRVLEETRPTMHYYGWVE